MTDDAYEEGEGDRSLEHWQKGHKQFFSSYKKDFTGKGPLICERFLVAYK